MSRARGMLRNYAQDVRLVRSPKGFIGVAALVVLFLGLPLFVNDSWANIFVIAGYSAIAALGLNLLTGYTGLPSLGTAGFIALGAFCASYLGRPEDALPPGGLDWAFWKYALAALAIGAGVGFVVGLPALRLRGVYLSIATLAIVFVTLYVLKSWETVSGGNSGASMPIEVRLFGLDFADLGGDDDIFLGDLPFRKGAELFSRNHGLMYLIWGFVAVAALLCKNIVRSRPGRALQAVRDRDVAAAVVGVSLFRAKVGAFVISSALATLAGVFYGLYIQYAVADEAAFGLPLSIQFLAIIVVGGIGTTYGPIIGALLIATIPKFIGFLSDLPLIKEIFTETPGEVGFSEGNFAAVLYALLIIVGLITQPHGLAGISRRIGGYFRSWPLAR
ncbi:MAG: branched-chain amino acid ABC transporter permease [Acidimicrobiia bacterium]